MSDMCPFPTPDPQCFATPNAFNASGLAATADEHAASTTPNGGLLLSNADDDLAPNGGIPLDKTASRSDS